MTETAETTEPASQAPEIRRETGSGASVPVVVRRAVILAAGRGDRLQPLTNHLPKCLVEVNGEPLLSRALRALAACGLQEATIVIGHLGEVIRERIGDHFAGLEIHYVDALDYDTTNNIRSLWDARDYFDKDILLLEADVIFDREVIEALVCQPGSSIAVAPYHSALSGTVVRRGEQAEVVSFHLGADQRAGFDPAGSYKTVNISLLRAGLLRDQLLPRLDRLIEDGQVQEYYERTFRDFVADGSVADLAAVDVSASRWYEIDDQRDLEAAEFLFLNRDSQFDRIQHLHGSYWRYGFVDHSYLYNMYFPPDAMLQDLQGDLREIVTNYPVGQAECARLISGWTGADPDQLVVANGAAELIKILGNEFLGDLAIATPSFNEYEEVIAADRLHRLPLAAPNFDLDLSALVAFAIDRGCDTAVVVSPNNPTARSVPRDDLLRAASELEAHDCRLIVDESFVEFAGEGLNGSVEPFLEAHPNLAVLKSMSKIMGIAGLRIGYLRSTDREFVDALRAELPIWNLNGLAEAFLRSVGRYRREFLESCDLTRATSIDLYERLQSLPGLQPIEPDANFVLCKLTPDSSGEPPDARSFARRLYVNHNILIKDCGAKSMPDANHYLRIAARTPAENRQLVDALRQLL